MLFDPNNGDTICFIGDSITHAGSFHKIIADFWTLRRPERRVRWVNCGISGDCADGALRRFDWDIAPHRPTTAFVMFGMNDGNRWLYEAAQAGTDGNAAARAAAIATHETNMAALLERLQMIGTREIILFSPTAYDQYTRLDAADILCGYEDALAAMGGRVRALAQRAGAGFVDLHAAFQTAVRTEALSGRGTYIYDDRVHPLPTGHLLMAITLLQALGATRGVARTEVTVGDAEAVADGATVSAVTTSADGLEWTYTARALPCVAPADAWDTAPEALRAVWRMLNRETLSIHGLAPGRHELSVDGQPVVAADAEAWAAGVDLADIAHAPQVVQAAEVCRLTATRHESVISRVRNTACARIFMGGERSTRQRQGTPLPEDEMAAARELLGVFADSPYIAGLYRDLLAYGSATAQAETQAQLAELDAAIARASAIPPRRYRVRRMAKG